MYLVQTFKFRYGEFADLFICNSHPQKGVRCIKERFLYFLFVDGKILGPYKTHRDCREIGLAMEIYQLVYENKVLVIEPRQIAQEVTTEEMYLRTATIADMERNTLYYEYVNKNLMGPFMMITDLCEFDYHLLRKIENGIIFIVNEKQSFSR